MRNKLKLKQNKLVFYR